MQLKLVNQLFSYLLKRIFRKHLLTKGTVNGEDQVLGQSSLTFLALQTSGGGEGTIPAQAVGTREAVCACTYCSCGTISPPPPPQHACSPITSLAWFPTASGPLPRTWGPLF